MSEPVHCSEPRCSVLASLTVRN